MIASFEHHPILIDDAALDRGVVMVSVEVTVKHRARAMAFYYQINRAARDASTV